MICFAIAAILMLPPCPAWAQGSLFYLEAQAVGGYSSAEREAIFYSMSPLDPMQKPSVGFDWLQRLSSESRDFGVIGVQARLAYNHEPDREVELQLYNAWFKYKAGFADFWIGHDRPAQGLSSYFDSHALLLPTLAMMGWGYDRDWGVGFNGDYSWGTIDGSWTLGSGMPIYFKGNHLFSARISFGVLEEENRNLGFSLGWGDVLETMGYELMSDEPESFRMAGFDLTHLWARYESRFEFMAQERDDDLAYALFWRFTMNLLEENRLKLEAQPVVITAEDEWSISPAAGISYQVTSDLALRAMYQYDDQHEDNRIVFQVYYYRGM
jgi:opacity protein-like surface antigen